jgi:hypothetical protein
MDLANFSEIKNITQSLNTAPHSDMFEPDLIPDADFLQIGIAAVRKYSQPPSEHKPSGT